LKPTIVLINYVTQKCDTVELNTAAPQKIKPLLNYQ